jgi:hypothetical protein
MRHYLKLFKDIRDEWVLVPTYKLANLILKSNEINLPNTKYKSEFEAWKISISKEK